MVNTILTARDWLVLAAREGGMYSILGRKNGKTGVRILFYTSIRLKIQYVMLRFYFLAVFELNVLPKWPSYMTTKKTLGSVNRNEDRKRNFCRQSNRTSSFRSFASLVGVCVSFVNGASYDSVIGLNLSVDNQKMTKLFRHQRWSSYSWRL